MPIADASGNTVMLIDPLTSAVVASYTYDAFGNVLSASGPMKDLCPFLGKGLYVHSEVPGLMFAANRVTDGRIWLSRDPSGESSDPNLYQLYNGDPINHSDPTGLYSEQVVGVTAIRWDPTDHVAKVAIEIDRVPSWFDLHVPGVGWIGAAKPAVRVEWLPVNSVPQRYASAKGLQQLATLCANGAGQQQDVWTIADGLRKDIADNMLLEKGIAATRESAGVTGLGPTGEGLVIASALTTISGIVRVGKEVVSADDVGAGGTAKGSANSSTRAAASRGSTLHSDKPGNLPDQLRQRYPDTEFEFTKPGVPGQDVRVVGGRHPSDYPSSNWPKGVDFADFKPDSPGGAKTFNSDQATKWAERTHMLPYDRSRGQLR